MINWDARVTVRHIQPINGEVLRTYVRMVWTIRMSGRAHRLIGHMPDSWTMGLRVADTTRPPYLLEPVAVFPTNTPLTAGIYKGYVVSI